MNELNENLRNDLVDSLFKDELEQLREEIIDKDSIYKEQLNMLIDILDSTKKLMDLNGKMLIKLNDSVEEVRTLTLQDTVTDLIDDILDAIITITLPRQSMENTIKEFGVPARELAVNLAVNLIKRVEGGE